MKKIVLSIALVGTMFMANANPPAPVDCAELALKVHKAHGKLTGDDMADILKACKRYNDSLKK